LGGIAVRVHAIPRPTFDVDIGLTVNEAQLSLFFASADELGYEISQPFRSGWRDEVGGMPLVKMKSFLADGKSVDVDIFITETQFQNSLMARRQQFEFEGRSLNFVSPEDLVLLKLLAYRPRDQGDISDILFIQGELDQSYLRNWAEQLQVSDRLEAALATNHTNGHE
jgi:hypothetical protein